MATWHVRYGRPSDNKHKQMWSEYYDQCVVSLALSVWARQAMRKSAKMGSVQYAELSEYAVQLKISTDDINTDHGEEKYKNGLRQIRNQFILTQRCILRISGQNIMKVE